MERKDQWQVRIEVASLQYVAARGTSGRMIHTAHAVRAFREAIPDCDLSDRQIADMVAETATSRGCDLCFDSHGEEAILPPPRTDFG